MADNIQQEKYIKLLTDLVTALRLIPIYPAKHPLVANSIKNTYSDLILIFTETEKFNISVSPDNKINVNGEPLTDRSIMVLQEFLPYFKRLEIEELIFTKGMTEKEVDDFLRVILMDPAEVKKSDDLNKIFAERSITNVKAKQFSYLKIEKGKEATVIEGKLSLLDSVKARIKDYCSDKIEKTEEKQGLQKDIFDLVGEEFKETKKLSSPVKNALKRFLLHNKEQDEAISRLKEALLAYGCPPGDVDALIKKISEEISKGPQKRKKSVSVEEYEKLKSENEGLKSKLSQIESEIHTKSGQVQQLEKQAKRIFEEKGRIDNIIHNLAEGMVVVDPSGKIVLVNPIAEQLLGITKDDIGKPIKEVVRDEHLLTMTKSIAVEKDGVVEKDIELLSPDEQTKKILRASSAVIEDNNGNTVGMVTMLNDVTKQKEVEKMKDDFLANVSHELRTPLVALDKSLTLTLSKETGQLTDTQAQFLSIAQRNLKRLSFLINDLLDLAKFEAKKMQIRPELASMGKIISDVLETMMNWASTKAIKLEKSVQDNIPDMLLDPNRMVQVFNNLIGNALKFTPKDGTITVSASLLADQNALRVSVKDTGPGIEKEDLVKIFDKFYQTKERTSSDISGTGIGLTIVKEIVELHGGKVWVESEKGQGAEFIFTLPVKTQQQDAEAGG